MASLFVAPMNMFVLMMLWIFSFPGIAGLGPRLAHCISHFTVHVSAASCWLNRMDFDDALLLFQEHRVLISQAALGGILLNDLDTCPTVQFYYLNTNFGFIIGPG